MLEARPVMRANRFVVTQKLIRTQHQLAKIHHPFALALFFVERIQLDFFAGFIVSDHHILRATALFFAPRNEVLHLFGRETLFIDIELFAQALDGRQLVLCVQNLKGLR